MESFKIVGGGLAGSEAAWQIARADFHVDLYEMRPFKSTGPHVSDKLAELVCSNSLGSGVENKPLGLLKQELKMLGSLLIECAERSAIPAGSALAVDRNLFSDSVTSKIVSHPNITLHREEVSEVPASPAIIATGPLTSDLLAKSIQQKTGTDQLFFYDALSPTVEAESINMDIAFKGSRYRFAEEESGDYINCPLNQEEYQSLISELVNAKTIPLREFEDQIAAGVKTSFFEACLPIEVMAKRSPMSLEYGPMRPVGIHNPHKEEKPRAVVQLRQENLSATEYNLVGFQTNLTFEEQRRVFRMIPGLENAQFTRYGQMHRNTYLNSPMLLEATMQSRFQAGLFFAGQITGTEGYVGNIASGLIAGINAVRFLRNAPLLVLPGETMAGALMQRVCTPCTSGFQPVKANFGLLPPIPMRRQSRPERGAIYATRALSSMREFIEENGLH